MGTNIETVDYKKLPGIANKMRSDGKDLNKNLVKAYSEIGKLQKSWYGKRYDALVTECNKLINDINKMTELVVDTIPYTLQTIAKNYASVDGGSTTSPSKESPTKITEVSKSGKETMKFIESDVDSSKTTIFNAFKEANNKMDSIENIFNGEVKSAWKSDAANTYASKFKKLKSNVSKSLDNIRTSFDKLVKQTITDMQKTEKANTVS